MNYHIPVLLDEAIRILDIKPEGIYMDCTVGFGGHSELLLEKLNSKGILIALDLDPYALEKAKIKLILNEIFPGENVDVPDPYYGGDQGFENVYQMLDEATVKIVEKIKNGTY